MAVSTRPSVRGEAVLNGAFGVAKPDIFTDTGLPVLRMIVDLGASNTILEQLEGDVKTLTGAAAFQKLIVGPDEELLISGDDLNAAFYLFRLPSWPQYLVPRKPVPFGGFRTGSSRGDTGGAGCIANGVEQRRQSAWTLSWMGRKGCCGCQLNAALIS